MSRERKREEERRNARQKAERDFTETDAYIELKAACDTMKEELGVIKEELGAVEEELNAVKLSVRKRPRVDEDVGIQKQCVTCGELRAFASFNKRGYQLSKCSSCRGKEYRANKKARATK